MICCKKKEKNTLNRPLKIIEGTKTSQMNIPGRITFNKYS